MAYRSEEETRKTRAKFEEILKQRPTREAEAEARAHLAHVLMIDRLRGWNNAAEDNVQQAKEHLKAIDRSAASPQVLAIVHVATSQIHEDERRLQGAVGALKEALKHDPDLAIAYAHLANAKILLGQAKKAPELLAKAISLPDADRGLCFWFMGRAYFNMGKYEDAIWWLEKSVKERSETSFTWGHLISAYALMGQLRGDSAQKRLKEYRQNSQKSHTDWPTEIQGHYNRAKYSAAPPELNEAVRLYCEGLQIANEIAGFP